MLVPRISVRNIQHLSVGLTQGIICRTSRRIRSCATRGCVCSGACRTRRTVNQSNCMGSRWPTGSREYFLIPFPGWCNLTCLTVDRSGACGWVSSRRNWLGWNSLSSLASSSRYFRSWNIINFCISHLVGTFRTLVSRTATWRY
jgi:hypothetical protein